MASARECLLNLVEECLRPEEEKVEKYYLLKVYGEIMGLFFFIGAYYGKKIPATDQ